MLLTLVIVYLLITIAIGLIAARRVKNTTDFAMAISPQLCDNAKTRKCWARKCWARKCCQIED